FTGMWAMFLAFYRLYPSLHKYLAISTFFIPSLFFWGSGILKDPLTISALGWVTFSVYMIFFEKKSTLFYVVVLLLSFYVLYAIKIYIILCFAPAALFWVFYGQVARIRNVVLRLMIAPLVLVLAAALGYYALIKIGEDSPRYS